VIELWIAALSGSVGSGVCIMRIIGQLFAVAATSLLLSAGSSLSQGRPAAVGVQAVEIRELTETVPVFAEIVTSRDGAVASRVAGNVDKVHVLAGTRVSQGDLLVELDAELLTILLAQAEAQMAEARAAIATATLRVDRTSTVFTRTEALRGSTAFSQGRFDEAEADLLEARSQLAEANARQKSIEAQVAEARYQLDRSSISAPFSGAVIEVNTIPGAYIQAGSPVVRLLDIDSFEVQASVPARLVTSLAVGQQMQGSLETGEKLTLDLRAILPIENTSTRTRAVRFSAPGLGAIRNTAIGQSVTVEIPVGAVRDVLSVPKDALVQGRDGWTVFVAAEGKAQPRPVQLGIALGNRYEVLGGVAPGDLVVVRGNERLRPGQDITSTPVEETN
jgi:RND family efflux transporter MFP subunit